MVDRAQRKVCRRRGEEARRRASAGPAGSRATRNEQAKVGQTGDNQRREEDRFGSEWKAESVVAVVAAVVSAGSGVAKWDEVVAVVVWAETKLTLQLEAVEVELQHDFEQQGRSRRSALS